MCKIYYASVKYYPRMFTLKKLIHIFIEDLCLDTPRLNMHIDTTPLSIYMAQKRGKIKWKRGEGLEATAPVPASNSVELKAVMEAWKVCFLQRIKATVEDVAGAAPSCVEDTKKNGENSRFI